MKRPHGHGSQSASAWLDQHLGGFITPFGAQAETFFEQIMVLIVNGFFIRAGWVAIALIMPVLLLELLLRTHL